MPIIIIAVVIVAAGLFWNSCNKNKTDSDNENGNYPDEIEEPVAVYYGPDYYEDNDESDNGSSNYPDEIEDPAPVYYGPDHFDDDE